MLRGNNIIMSRRAITVGTCVACVLPAWSPLLADPGNSYEHLVPAGVGISRYTVRRDRAERSFVTLQYYDYFADRWVIDNVQDPPEEKNIDRDVALARPSAFQPSDKPLRLRVSGEWMPDNSQHNPFERTDAAQFADRVEIYMYARGGDPNGTAIAKLFYTHNIPIP